MISLTSLQRPFAQTLRIFADEFLTADADIPWFALAFGDSTHGLSWHPEFEGNMSFDSTKKIRNIRAFGLTVKNISLFANDMFQKSESYWICARYAHRIVACGALPGL
jgi:hypothetical protein